MTGLFTKCFPLVISFKFSKMVYIVVISLNHVQITRGVFLSHSKYNMFCGRYQEGNSVLTDTRRFSNILEYRITLLVSSTKHVTLSLCMIDISWSELNKNHQLSSFALSSSSLAKKRAQTGSLQIAYISTNYVHYSKLDKFHNCMLSLKRILVSLPLSIFRLSNLSATCFMMQTFQILTVISYFTS